MSAKHIPSIPLIDAVAAQIDESVRHLNGMQVIARRTDPRYGGVILMRLPRALWRECGTCRCPHCKGAVGYWDTLAVALEKPVSGNDYVWTVHCPKPYSAVYE